MPQLRDDRRLAAALRSENEHDRLRIEPAARQPCSCGANGGERVIPAGLRRPDERLVDRTQVPEQRRGGYQAQNNEADAERDAFALGEREHAAEQPGQQHEGQEDGENGIPAGGFATSHWR